jgi:hypothetical protein
VNLKRIVKDGVKNEKGVAYPMSIFFFAGLSLIIYFFVARKLDKE